MAEAITQIQREAPFLEDYRRRLLESAFKKADSPTPVARRGIAEMAKSGNIYKQVEYMLETYTYNSINK